MSDSWICITCGVQYPRSPAAPDACPICEDERQFVDWNGQQWTSLADLRSTHGNKIDRLSDGVHSVATEPFFGIGQIAHRVAGDTLDLLWDCTPLCPGGEEQIEELGGLDAIAISHPHFYSTMVEWARAFDVPIYLHADDRQWIQVDDPHIILWEGERKSLDADLTLQRCGGHFEGGTVLHRAGRQDSADEDRPAALFSSDIIQVVQDRRWVSFMRSYPNLIPLGAGAIQRILAAIADLDFEVLYGAWPGRIVGPDAHGVVRRSAARYLEAIAS